MRECIKFILPNWLINKLKLIRIYLKRFQSDKLVEKTISKRYKKYIGGTLNWDNPQTYNEKINVAKRYNNNEFKSKLTDKYCVREWVKETIGEEYLIPLVGVYNCFDEIDFSKLPDKFVIKCNHDCGSVTICNDKNRIDYKELKEKYDFYMQRNFGLATYQKHYEQIKPKIIIEKNMGENITDYKFLCFDGVPYFCRLDFDRFGDHQRNIYDMKWNLQSFNKGPYKNKSNIDKPDNFEEMIDVVKKLSKNIDQVRVDLYNIDNKIYFGEMTFTNGNGMERFYPNEYDKKIGELWNFKSNRGRK